MFAHIMKIFFLISLNYCIIHIFALRMPWIFSNGKDHEVKAFGWIFAPITVIGLCPCFEMKNRNWYPNWLAENKNDLDESIFRSS